MACFLVPAAEAVIVTAAAQIMRKKEEKIVSLPAAQKKSLSGSEEKTGFFTPRKLMWLSYLLWGGAFLLAYEHVWHGEVVPWFPFLTAAADPADAAVMLHEMATAGVAMAVLVTAVWFVIAAVCNQIVRRPENGAVAR